MCATPVKRGGTSGDGGGSDDRPAQMATRLKHCTVALYVRVVFVRAAIFLGSVSSQDSQEPAGQDRRAGGRDGRGETSVERWLWEEPAGMEADDPTALARPTPPGGRDLPARTDTPTVQAREENGRLCVYDPEDSDSYISSDVYEPIER